jgi:hypothetical protein
MKTLTTSFLLSATLALNAVPSDAAGPALAVSPAALAAIRNMQNITVNASANKITFAVNLQFRRVMPGAKAVVGCFLNNRAGAEIYRVVVTPNSPVAGADGNLNGVVNVEVGYAPGEQASLGTWQCGSVAYTGTWASPTWQSNEVDSLRTSF